MDDETEPEAYVGLSGLLRERRIGVDGKYPSSFCRDMTDSAIVARMLALSLSCHAYSVAVLYLI
jgi:hypothetical protein